MPGQVDVKGFDSTIGYTQWANKPAKQDAPVRTSPPYHFSPLLKLVMVKARCCSARSWCYRDLQDERPTDITGVRELQPALGPHAQPMVNRTYRRRLLGRRGRATRHGRCRARRWHGHRRKHTNPIGVLRDLWVQTGLRTRLLRGHGRCVRLSPRGVVPFSFVHPVWEQIRTPVSKPSTQWQVRWPARCRTSSECRAFCLARGTVRTRTFQRRSPTAM